jgi:hypothetical protein
MRENIQFLVFWARLTSLRMMFYSSIHLPANDNISFFFMAALYPNECDTGYSRGTCTPMFIAALFTIAKLCKQPRGATTNKWIKKMWYLYTMEFYAAMKKNDPTP